MQVCPKVAILPTANSMPARNLSGESTSKPMDKAMRSAVLKPIPCTSEAKA